MERPTIAVFSGPRSTIANSPTLVTGNKGRLPHERVLPGRYDHLVPQFLHEPAVVRIRKYSAHPLEEDSAPVYHQDGNDYYEVELRPEDGPYPLPYVARRANGTGQGQPFEEADLFDPGLDYGGRQFFYPDASRMFAEIDRTISGRDESGEGSVLDRRADFDFIRVLRTGRLHPEGREDPASTTSPTGPWPSAARPATATWRGPPTPSARPWPAASTPAASGSRAVPPSRRPSTGSASSSTPTSPSPDAPPSAPTASSPTTATATSSTPSTSSPQASATASAPWASRTNASTRHASSRKPTTAPATTRPPAGTAASSAPLDRPSPSGTSPPTATPPSSDVNLSKPARLVSSSPDYADGCRHVAGIPVKDGSRSPAGNSHTLASTSSSTAPTWTRTRPPTPTTRSTSWPASTEALRDQASSDPASPGLHGFVLEGSSPYGLGGMSQHRALEVAAFSGMPVARVGRADPGGRVPSGWDDVTIAGSNLDCNKARLLLMAAMLKLGRLPKARDPRAALPREERAATVAAVARYQDIFENH